ncbi:hypothetical protein Tco_0633184 [Tanacetum coccineum]
MISLRLNNHPFAEAISSIPSIVNEYLGSKMKEAVDVAIQLKLNTQAENQEFLNSLYSNMQKIIKDQVKTQTSKIKSKVEKYVTESLGVEVLIYSTNQPQTSYGIASSLSELELRRILIDKIEENKSIDRSDVQKNLYNALVEAYNIDKETTYWDEKNDPRDDLRSNFRPLFIGEFPSSVGENRGVKGCTIIAIIYDFGVTAGENISDPKHAVTKPTRVVSTPLIIILVATVDTAVDTVVAEVGTADNTGHTVVEHT